MANINCARFTAIKASASRAGLASRAIIVGAMLCALCLSAQASEAPAVDHQAPLADRVNADPAFPFSNEIAAFAKADAGDPAPSGGILFLGSSSIRLWNIGGSFPDRPVVNRGFGGATTADVLHYYARLLPRAKPGAIIVYVGENDLAGGATPADVSRNVLRLLKRLREDYPKARIAYLSLKPSPIRWTLWPRLAAVNMTVAARSRAVGFDYLDVGTSLLARDGLPDASLFRPDGLHMNARGYGRWTRLVDGWLHWGKGAAPSPS